jgi:hypothetical protein
MTVEVLFSLITGLFTAVAAWCCFCAAHYRDRASDTARELAKRLARLQLLEEELAVLNKRLTKLTGRFYRTVRDERGADEPREDEPDERPAAAGVAADDDLSALIALQSASPVKP